MSDPATTRIRRVPRDLPPRGRDWGRVRALIILLVLCALGGGVVLYALHQPVGKRGAAGQSVQPCPAGTVRVNGTTGMRLRVYNTTARPGLAANTALALQQRGYLVTTVDNAATIVRGGAELRYGPAGAATARALARIVPGAVLRPDRRPDGVVDLLLGGSFRGLAPVPVSSSAPPLGCVPTR